MLKKIIINAFIGIFSFFFGWLIHDLFQQLLGLVILFLGVGYSVISIGYILFTQGLPLLGRSATEREKRRFQDDLFKYKKLFDEGILTEEEYAKKSKELKSNIL